MRGIKFSDGFLRPDAWVIGSLVKAAAWRLTNLPLYLS